MLMCEHCIEELRSRGELVGVYEMRYTADECEENDVVCEWCEEADDLYTVDWVTSGSEWR